MLKYVEIRDVGTTIPAVCFRPSAIYNYSGAFNPIVGKVVSYGLERTGYSRHNQCVVLMRLDDCRAKNDPYEWGNSSRTMTAAHAWIDENFDRINHGDVVDVQFILGQTNTPKISEALQ